MLSLANTLILVYWGIARKTLDDYGLETELGMEMAWKWQPRTEHVHGLLQLLQPPTATTPTREPQKSKDQKTRSHTTGDKDREDRRQDPKQKKDRGEGKKRKRARNPGRKRPARGGRRNRSTASH